MFRTAILTKKGASGELPGQEIVPLTIARIIGCNYIGTKACSIRGAVGAILYSISNTG